MSTPTTVAETPGSAARHAPPPAVRQGVSGFWFVFPFLVFFVAFLVWPVVYGLWMSFTNQSLTGAGGGFAGVSNYGEAFTDYEVRRTLGHTL